MAAVAAYKFVLPASRPFKYQVRVYLLQEKFKAYIEKDRRIEG